MRSKRNPSWLTQVKGMDNMTKPKIIMDVDTGTDDAVALTLAMLGGEVELLGITTVNGNLELKLTTDNTLRVVDYCGKGSEVKVYSGCEYPLVSTLSPTSPQSLHPIPKREGMKVAFAMHSDHLPLPETNLRAQPKSAVLYLVETVMAAEPGTISIVALGPLTNIATAMRAEPSFASRLKEIVLMGGGDQVCNESAAAEFNIWTDPEAAEIILQSGCKLSIIPLDATHEAEITATEADEIAAIGGKEARFVADVIRSRIGGYSLRDPDLAARQAAPLHDALALCYLLHPECISRKIETVCHVDISGGYAYGRTILDRRANLVMEKPNCTFALGANREWFLQWMCGILKRAAQ